MDPRETGMRRGLRRGLTVAGAALLALGVTAPALAAGTNLLRIPSFERPVIATPSKSFTAGQSLGTCSSGARNCWLITQGNIDLVGSLWTAKAGLQSIELQNGPPEGQVEQAFTTAPGTSYRVTFFLSSDPAATDNVGVRVTWEDIDVHGDTTGSATQDFTYFNPAHTATSMDWVKHTLVVPATDVEGRLFFTNLTVLPDPSTGPALDKVSVKPI